MIVYPQQPAHEAAMMEFLRTFAHVQPSKDMKVMGWLGDGGHLVMVVGFNAFIGATCQIHVAMVPDFHFTPKAMLEAVFRHAFDDFNRAKLIGIVNSKNTDAMKYDLHLGFKEEFRMPGLHDDGGDIVILGMTRAECKYLKNKPRLMAA